MHCSHCFYFFFCSTLFFKNLVIFIFYQRRVNKWSCVLVYSKMLALMAPLQKLVLVTVIGGPPEDSKSNFLNICSQDQSSARQFWCLQRHIGPGFTVSGVFIIYTIRMQTVFIFPLFSFTAISHILALPRVSLRDESARWRHMFNAHKCEMSAAPCRLLFGKIMRWVKDFQET